MFGRCVTAARRVLCIMVLPCLLPFGLWAGESIDVSVWEPPFDFENASRTTTYRPLDRATRRWRFCISYPHLKDPYWFSVNFGMTMEAKRLGAGFRLVEAGGYPFLSRQIALIRDCLATGPDALVVGTVSFNGLTPLLRTISPDVPVIAAVNDIHREGIVAKVGVSWVEMGHRTGAFLAARHPRGTAPARIALFPGPHDPEWVAFELKGFSAAIADSALQIVAMRRGDTGKEIQRNLVEDVLEETRDLDYIVGTAPTAEAAVSLLRENDLAERIAIVSFYLTHGIYRGIRRGKILAAPTDSPVRQGRLALEVATRVLEGKLIHPHLGPEIVMVDQSNVDEIDPLDSLAPVSFSPVFEIP